MNKSITRMFPLLMLPLLSVLTQVGLTASFPQLREFYGSVLRASTFIAVMPFAAMCTGTIWGVVVRKIGLNASVLLSLGGWSLTIVLYSFLLPIFPVVIALRALQGVFDAGFAALPLVAGSRPGFSERERVRYLGLFETLATVGAIAGPLAMGSVFLFSPRGALWAVAGLGLLTIVFFALRRPEERRKRAGLRAAAAGTGAPRKRRLEPETHRHFSFRILLPAAFAVSALVLLVAAETFIPVAVEARYGSPLLGKLVVTIYEAVVVVGVMGKARIPGVRRFIPLALGACFGVSYLARDVTPLLAAGMLLSAVGIGLALTMGNEFAARTSAGFEEHGMSLYASLKISGGFIGPYFAAFGFPFVLLPLGALSLVSTLFLRRSGAGKNVL